MSRLERMEALLREAADAITLSRPSDVALVSRIAEFLAEPGCEHCGALDHPSVQCIAAGLVLERLPSGEFAWLEPERTTPRYVLTDSGRAALRDEAGA